MTAASVSSGPNASPSSARLEPGTTLVAPFSSVKSVIAQMVLHCTSYPRGKGKKSKAHWSRWMGWAVSSGPMAMAWVRCSWMFVACDRSARAVPTASGWVTSSRHEGDRATSAPVRLVSRPLKLSGPCGRGLEEGPQFLVDAIEEGDRRQAVDHGRAVVPDDRRHVLGGRCRSAGGRWARGHPGQRRRSRQLDGMEPDRRPETPACRDGSPARHDERQAVRKPTGPVDQGMSRRRRLCATARGTPLAGRRALRRHPPPRACAADRAGRRRGGRKPPRASPGRAPHRLRRRPPRRG